MRINNLSSLMAAQQYNTTSKKTGCSGKTEKFEHQDKLEVSQEALALHHAKTAVLKDSGVREEKVQLLREQYLDGTYNPTSLNVALAMLRG